MDAASLKKKTTKKNFKICQSTSFYIANAKGCDASQTDSLNYKHGCRISTATHAGMTGNADIMGEHVKQDGRLNADTIWMNKQWQ